MKKAMVLASIILFFCSVTTGQQDTYKGKVFIGIVSKNIPLPEDPAYESKFGIYVKSVSVGSSADIAGIKAGDIIVSIDGAVWKSDDIRLSKSFGKVGEKATPGEQVEIMYLRKNETDPKATYVLYKVVFPLQPYPGTAAEKPFTPSNEQIRPDLKDIHPVYETLCNQLVNKYGFHDDTTDLLARIARCQLFPDKNRLAMMRYMHRDPFKLEAVTHEVIDSIKSNSDDVLRICNAILKEAMIALVTFNKAGSRQLYSATAAIIPSYKGGNLQAHLDYIETVLKKAAELNKAAFADLTKAEMDVIKKHRSGLLESFIKHKMLSYESDRPRQEACYAILNLAAKVEIFSLIKQAEIVALLIEPDFTESLKNAVENSGKDLNATIIVKKETLFGLIAISGKKRTRHSKNYAVLYDLGGDDVYANNQAGSRPDTIPSAVIVDYAGNDSYESTYAFTQGSGDMGVGILYDKSGNDNYIALSYSQGTSFMGVGVLIDETGNDVYRGMTFHQGVGHWGAGFLVDMDGDDKYESHMASQGVGLAGGFGLIYEKGGNDSYYCKGLQKTGYGTDGVFEGWGQGVGFGYRPYASGGVGILFDNNGSDRIEGGNFSQGGGYFYGVGILYCGGKDDDVYIGSRYAQGFSAHQAVGVMIEEGGNDRYQTRHCVGQGLAWDESVTLFIEHGGDDIYEGGNFSQCASAMNGFAIFLELGGKDTYLYDKPCSTGGNSYHGGHSLSFFVDAGGDMDTYSGRTNNDISSGPGNIIFCDLPGSIDQAVKTTLGK